jgi:hypothetical protein
MRELEPADPEGVRAEYVMRPLEFLVAYRGRHWLTDLIRSDGKNGPRSLAEAVRSGRSNRLAAKVASGPGSMKLSTIDVPEARPRLHGRTREAVGERMPPFRLCDEVFGTCGGILRRVRKRSRGRARAKPANLSSLPTYARGGRFRRPPLGRTYQTRRATTMTAAAIATTATVEAATTTRRF